MLNFFQLLKKVFKGEITSPTYVIKFSKLRYIGFAKTDIQANKIKI